jgi:hypothetical protein|nr:MAG TPA: hypothetical protein [Bacteriophage sp.]
MDYTVQEIRFTAEDYVSCVDLFYKLKATGKNIKYDLPITSIDSCGIDFKGDFYNYKLSDEVLDALGALDGKLDMTVGKLLKRLKYVITHAIYPLYEVSAKAMIDKTLAKLCPNFTTHELLQGNSFKGFLDFLSMCYDAYTFFVDGDYLNCCVRYCEEDKWNYPFHMYNNRGDDIRLSFDIMKYVAFTDKKEIAVHEVVDAIEELMYMASKLHLNRCKHLEGLYTKCLQDISDRHLCIKYQFMFNESLAEKVNTYIIRDVDGSLGIRLDDISHYNTYSKIQRLRDALKMCTRNNHSLEDITIFDIVSAMVCHTDRILCDLYGKDYATFGYIDTMFLDNIGYAYKDTHPHISQAINLYVIYYNRHLVKNHTYSFLEQICHAITFNSETMDGDVECIVDNDFTFNRGYREMTIPLDQYIDIDNTPVVNANMDARGYVISNILVKMLDYLKVLGATWYCHTRFTHSIAMLVMMSELMYHPKDYVFYDYSVTQSFDFISNEYISDEEDDVLMCKGSMLPSFGLYTLDTLREKTGFRSLEYILSARKGLLTIMNGITKQLQGVHDEVEDIELVHDMNNYDKFFTLKLTYHNGDITTRDVYVDAKEWDNVCDYILASESDAYKYLVLFNTKMALYTFKTHVNSILHLIDRVGQTYELYNKNHDDMHHIKNRLSTLMEYAYKDYAVRKKEEKSSNVDTTVNNEVETEDTTQSTDIVLATLQNMSSKVNIKDIARVLATEYMIHGYDFLDMEDDTLYVYTTDRETKEVIPKSLHRFFTYVGDINKLPLLYYLID